MPSLSAVAYVLSLGGSLPAVLPDICGDGIDQDRDGVDAVCATGPVFGGIGVDEFTWWSSTDVRLVFPSMERVGGTISADVQGEIILDLPLATDIGDIRLEPYEGASLWLPEGASSSTATQFWSMWKGCMD